MSNSEIVKLFFSDLKTYNTTNYRTLVHADLTEITPTIYKSFSSVITRYFIFAERHPELTASELKLLYYKLKIDMIATFFTSYPDINVQMLLPFQLELQNHITETKEGTDDSRSASI